MKKLLILLLAMLVLTSCTPENKTPTVEVPPSQEETPATPETPKDPFEESPLSSVVVTAENPTKTLQGTWLMYTGGNLTDKIIICLDSNGTHTAAFVDKEDNLINTSSYIDNSVIYRLWISGYAQYEPLAYMWNDGERMTITYTDRLTSKKTVHSMRKYSDSFIDDTAFEDTSLIYGLWVNADKTKGLRFLSDGTLWIYKGDSSEKCRWKDSDGNALAVMDSFGFSEKVPFTKIGDNLLVYKGEKYFKAE